MSLWGSRKERIVFRALLRIGWQEKSHGGKELYPR